MYKPWRLKGIFQFEITINVLFSSSRFIWISTLWVYGHYNLFNSFSIGTVFRRQNLTSIDVRFWRLKTFPALKWVNNWWFPTFITFGYQVVVWLSGLMRQDDLHEPMRTTSAWFKEDGIIMYSLYSGVNTAFWNNGVSDVVWLSHNGQVNGGPLARSLQNANKWLQPWWL